MINSKGALGSLGFPSATSAGKLGMGDNLQSSVDFAASLGARPEPRKTPPPKVLASAAPGSFRVLNVINPSHAKVVVTPMVAGKAAGLEVAEVGKAYLSDSGVLIPKGGTLKVQWSDGEVKTYSHAEHPKLEVLDAARAGSTIGQQVAVAEAAAAEARQVKQLKDSLKKPGMGTPPVDLTKDPSLSASEEHSLAAGASGPSQKEIEDNVQGVTSIQLPDGTKKLQLNLSDIQLQSQGQAMAAETDLYNVSFAMVAKALSTLELPEAVQNHPQLQTCAAVIADQLVGGVLVQRATALMEAVDQNIRTRLDAVRSLYAQIPPESRGALLVLLKDQLTVTCNDIGLLSMYPKGTPASLSGDAPRPDQLVNLNIGKYEQMRKDVAAAVSGASVPDVGADVLANLYSAMISTIELGDLEGDLGAMANPVEFFTPVFVGSSNIVVKLTSGNFFPYEYCMTQWKYWAEGRDGQDAGPVGEAIASWFSQTNTDANDNSFSVANEVWSRLPRDPRGLPYGCSSGSYEWYNSISNRMLAKPIWSVFESKAAMRKGMTLVEGTKFSEPIILCPPELLARITAATEGALTMLFNHAMTLVHLMVAVEGVTPNVAYPYQQFFTNGAGAPAAPPYSSTGPFRDPIGGKDSEAAALKMGQPPAFQAAIATALSSDKPQAFGPGGWFERWMQYHDAVVPLAGEGAYYEKTSNQLLNEASAKSYEEIVLDFVDSNAPMAFALNAKVLYEKATAGYKQVSDPERLMKACEGLDAGLISCITAKLQLEIFAILGNEDSQHAKNIVALMSANTQILNEKKESFDKLAARFVQLVGNEVASPALLQFTDYQGPGLLNELRDALEEEKAKPLADRSEPEILKLQTEWSVLLQEMISLKAQLGDLTDSITLQAFDAVESGNVGNGVRTVSESSVVGSISQDGKSCLFQYIDENGELVEGTSEVNSSDDAATLNSDSQKTNEDTLKDLGDNFKDVSDALDGIGGFGSEFGFTFLNPGSNPILSDNEDSISKIAKTRKDELYTPPSTEEEGGLPWFLLLGAAAAAGGAPLAVAGGLAALQLFVRGSDDRSA